MLANFITSFNTVFPLFAILAVGAFLNKKGLCCEITQNEVNNIVFKALLPMLIFKNIFYTDFETDFEPGLVIFVIIMIIVQYIIISIIMSAIEKRPKTRGALIHCSFRTNSLIYGMAILVNMYGTEKLGSASIAIAFAIPLINVFAVYTLEKNRGGRVEAKNILMGIAKNPVIITTIIAILFRIVGISSFPAFITGSIDMIAAMATPVALLFLGASVKFSNVYKDRRNIAIGVCTKLIFQPLLILTCAILIGFRGIDLAAILAIFTGPTAITCFPMSVAMESDYELTGEIVAFTTALASITMFMWIFILMQTSLI